MQRSVHSKLRRECIQSLFETGGGIAALSERAGSFSYAVAREFCRLEKYFFRILLYFAVKTAHDPRKRNAAFAVANEQIVFMEHKFLFIERNDLFAFLCASHVHLAAAQEVTVERVHGLTEFQQYKVGDIDDIRNRADSAQRQTATHPLRRFADFNILYVMTDIARTEIFLVHPNGNNDVRLHRRIRNIRLF